MATTSDPLRRSAGLGIRAVCRPTVEGVANVPAAGPFIVASNHLSFLDSVILQALSPRMVHFFAKAEYFTAPGLKGKAMKWFFESVGSIPVQRGEQAASVAALDSLVELLETGSGVGIYPEGTRSRDGRLYRGRTGVGWLTLTTGAPVVPVGLIGTERLQAPDDRLPKPHRFTVRFGEPLHFGHPGRRHTLPARREATAAVMDAIAALTGQERVDSYNAPPASRG
ncbi:lysophospholipid acyltransferase family protein [Micrococcus lylae]|nr:MULTISPECIES: lysophospholipid acyltransferase family protein [Micrococcus]MCT2008122.1 1-acyl-sn-glycerol-3-phosphate acyltransferase [Micrococcus lylae]MCT2071931.1 1-acyl-sn-glycerol-3-phosphate acyltransferase [Micrococcus lylae]PNL17973.1 1-acyl-sn-glycerol-3-phosphate acyltransferase [Micrococcus sp. FDAARGOS_333]WIK82854.1 lysophospholipid acyltransferase family protein [Micrococcus lylae]